MRRTSLLCVVALVLLEACSVSGPRKSGLATVQLVAGASLPLPASSLPAPPSEEQAFGLDDEMRAFVAPLKGIRDPIARLNRLRELMQQRGLFSIVYTGSSTRT